MNYEYVKLLKEAVAAALRFFPDIRPDTEAEDDCL